MKTINEIDEQIEFWKKTVERFPNNQSYKTIVEHLEIERVEVACQIGTSEVDNKPKKIRKKKQE